ncbi:MAG: lysozyme inhibitor LprI family protein [Pseudomonadota bacterium]
MTWRPASALRAAALAGSALLAVPASADPLEALAACIDAAQRAEDMRACIGAASNACIEAGGASSRNVIGCFEEEADAWDARLNEGWERLKTRTRAADEASPPEDPEDRLWETLLAAQRAWLAFRDAECASAIAGMGGTGRSESESQCRLRMTAERVVALRFVHDSHIESYR